MFIPQLLFFLTFIKDDITSELSDKYLFIYLNKWAMEFYGLNLKTIAL